MNSPFVLYLDQNKWIELARSVKDPTLHPETYGILRNIQRYVLEGRLLVPLSQTNLYETHKINDSDRRNLLALLQASISQGWFFRSLGALLQAQLEDFLCSELSIAVSSRPPLWFLSRYFFEAAAEYNPLDFGFEIQKDVMAAIHSNPALALFHYLTTSPDDARREAVRKYSLDSKALIVRMQERRKLSQNEPLATRKRAYSALLLIDQIDEIHKTSANLGHPVRTIGELGSAAVISMASKVAAFDIECELVVTTESENRVQDENDLRDVLAFTIVLPYANAIVAEKAVINRARQSKLRERYSGTLFTSLDEWEMPEEILAG
jgi:hypothetical protein